MQLRSAALLFSTRDDFEGSRLGCIQLNSIRRNNSEWYSASFTIRRDLPIRAFETPNSVYIYFFCIFCKAASSRFRRQQADPIEAGSGTLLPFLYRLLGTPRVNTFLVGSIRFASFLRGRSLKRCWLRRKNKKKIKIKVRKRKRKLK